MNKVLKIIKSTKSWMRQAGVNTPHLNHFVAYACTQGLEKLAPGYAIKLLLTFFREKGDKTFWVFTEKETLKVAANILKNPRVYSRLYRMWQVRLKEYYKFVEKFLNQGIKNLENDYATFKKVYVSEYTAAMITEYPTIILSDQVFQEFRKKYGKENKDLIQKILLPSQKTFMNTEELSALKIGLKLKRHLSNPELREVKLSKLKEKYPEIYKAIHKHQKNFFWIQANYKYTEPVSASKFLETIKETVINLNPEKISEKIQHLENYEKILQKEKKEIYCKLKMSKEDQEKAALISTNGFWHDARKKANLIGNYIINEFLKRYAKEHGYTLLELQYTLPVELDNLTKGIALDRKTIHQRIKFATHIIGANVQEQICTGEEAKKLSKMTETKRDSAYHDLRGTPASYGVAQGKVRIIHNPKGEDIEEGEILVTSMTRPDFAPLMKKAAAIVTEEGGITSHAAIISRELEKPCVVGTRVATKVLKDGDFIEVNANHGIIKILKTRI